MSLLSSKKDQGTIVNSRFLRWLLFLQNYNFVVRYRPKKYTANADALSRLPQPKPTGISEQFAGLKAFHSDARPSVNKGMIKEEMLRDELCRKLYETIKVGWPGKKEIPDYLRVFYSVRAALSLGEGCIFYGDRVFVPPSLRAQVLDMLHTGHFGVIKCKRLARQSVWWPRLDANIEDHVNSCEMCQVNSRGKSYHRQMPWAPTSKPFERVHVDHFFFGNKIFLLIVDEFSNWMDVKMNSSVTSKCVIMALKEFMSAFGLPKVLVSDNATCFNSFEFENFCENNNIKHVNSPAYRPQSNGLAERSVGIVKERLRKFLAENGNGRKSLEEQITEFLFMYRTSPLSLKASPASLIFKFNVRTNISSLSKQVPNDYSSRVADWDQSTTKTTTSTSTRTSRNFEANQPIYYYHSLRRSWIPACIVSRKSYCLYVIKLVEGTTLVAHASSIKIRYKENREQEVEGERGMILRSGREK